MNLKTQRRIAAKLLKVGINRVRFDPEMLTEIKEAITKSDIRSLIKKGAIMAMHYHSQSRFRVRKKLEQKRKGRGKGQGSRRGKKTARLASKKVWMNKIRLQRSFLRNLKEKNLIDTKIYRDLMHKAKGGFFRSKRHIKLFIEEHNLIKEKK